YPPRIFPEIQSPKFPTPERAPKRLAGHRVFGCNGAMIVTCHAMRELEERAVAAGATAESLMNDAGRQIAAAVRQFCPVPGHCRVCVGKGHNGGDALVAARHLAEAGWALSLREVFPREALAPLTAKKLGELLA